MQIICWANSDSSILIAPWILDLNRLKKLDSGKELLEHTDWYSKHFKRLKSGNVHEKGEQNVSNIVLISVRSTF